MKISLPTYGRFKELRTKAKEELKEGFNLEKQLENALCEICWMREDNVPEHKWKEVSSIIKACNTQEPVGDEGKFSASINKMTYEEKLALKRAITML